MKNIEFLKACLCTPAFAASTVDIDCDEATKTIHEIAVAEITADPASPDFDLPPKMRILRNDAREEKASVAADVANEKIEEILIRDSLDRSLPLTLPGGETALYKRRMYRTDI